MCTNFTSLNKACPKDFYLLHSLGRLVDGSAGHEVFDFMDASRSYHQIRMLPEVEEKTTFFIEYDLFWVEERWCDIPKNGRRNIRELDMKKHGDLCRCHVGEKQ
ncbi:hypothetical protein LIER_16093 [Lithospermum erythrorhizon]|uniref:Uncharacterized protein n=1 Tax=Lithospermum erythrorhizon TaxID=34254 RepID=A0AAV3Q9G6_LITER